MSVIKLLKYIIVMNNDVKHYAAHLSSKILLKLCCPASVIIIHKVCHHLLDHRHLLMHFLLNT